MQPLLITMGDPTGVGPELIVKALLDGSLDTLKHPLHVVGDAALLARTGRIFNVEGIIEEEHAELRRIRFRERSLTAYNLSQLDAGKIVYGRPNRLCAKAMIDYIEFAISACRRGEAAGLITCPINKSAINDAGYNFPGHTELLADRCGLQKVVMMLAGAKLKVCLVTTHLSLADVSASLNRDDILATIRITAASLRRHFGLEQPQIAVLALNPHAGENGLFGNEEQQVITPAIVAAQKEGIAADGPHSADTLFHFAVNGSHDAVVCMYHDQGLIPLKMLHFDDAVNVTLGLPIVRTSVDHGTAYNIAGLGTANTASLVEALHMAEHMAFNHEPLN